MNPDFAIIREFLERCGAEVGGRAVSSPPPELAERFERFARGECSAEDRASLCDLLRTQPEYLRVLAGRVKDLRVAATDPKGAAPRS